MATPIRQPLQGWAMPQGAGVYGYLIVDIETANPPEEELRKYFEATWRAPSNYKDKAKIAAKREEAWESCKEHAALKPCAPIIAIGLKSETELRCLHAMREHAPMERLGGLVESFPSEKAMLAAFGKLLAARASEDTVISGLNIKWFDLPAIRRGLARHGMEMPDPLLNPDQPVWDNMEKWCRLYSGERDVTASCPEVSMGLGITPHKISGKVVPELFAAGEYEMVMDKVLLDVLEEEQQFLRMTGRQR